MCCGWDAGGDGAEKEAESLNTSPPPVPDLLFCHYSQSYLNVFHKLCVKREFSFFVFISTLLFLLFLLFLFHLKFLDTQRKIFCVKIFLFIIISHTYVSFTHHGTQIRVKRKSLHPSLSLNSDFIS